MTDTRTVEDLLTIPSFLDRRGEGPPPPLPPLRRRPLTMPKAYPAGRLKREQRALRRLGYPDTLIRGSSPEWRAKAIEAGIRYVDNRAEIAEIDRKTEEAVRLTRTQSK